MLPAVRALGEAEVELARMSRANIFTEDSDAMVFGARHIARE
jgi:hypothetical protein